MDGLRTIIALSLFLALGFLLVILSSALFSNYYPLLVVATYILAPLPNAVCSWCTNPDDFIDDTSSTGLLDLGRFLTGFMVVMGIALPAALAHSGVINMTAAVMSVVGGLCIYGTVVVFGWFFRRGEEF